ncbi:holin family protein [Paenibacillus sp. NPDC057967]|uniref:phage holin family protein n=1 Tax=Paenibacillus sp. NPDC057967 TaxID=3346293 RepID=UPI0036DA7958
MNLVTINGITGAVASAAGAVIGFAFGHWTEALTFLLIAIAADIITGTYASVKEGRGLNSAVGSVGLAKKGLMFLVILLAHRMDVLLDMQAVTMSTVVYFYIANEMVSFVENIGRAGLPLPGAIKKLIEVLKDKGGVEDNKKGSNV